MRCLPVCLLPAGSGPSSQSLSFFVLSVCLHVCLSLCFSVFLALSLSLSLSLCTTGQKGRVTIPQKYAYGEKGFPPVIPPLAALTYTVELISFSRGGYQTGSREVIAASPAEEIQQALQLKT